MTKKKERLFYRWNELDNVDTMGLGIAAVAILLGLFEFLKINLNYLVAILVLILVILGTRKAFFKSEKKKWKQ